MEFEENYFRERKEKAYELFFRQREIYNPYFQTKVIINSDGFHHLQFSGRHERNKREQLLKFSLIPFALDIIRRSGTVQEYRKLMMPIGKPSAQDGGIRMKLVEYWGMIGIVGKKQMKVRVVLRRVGNGNVTFWSVMLYSKIKKGEQKLFTEGIEDE